MITRTFSKEFQSVILDLFEMCVDNDTDTLEIKFEYPIGTVEVEMTFKAYKNVAKEAKE